MDDSWFDWSGEPNHSDFEPYPDDWHEPSVRGTWSKEYRANRNHDCVRHSPYCPGEIGKGEIYVRTAVLLRPEGSDRRGTVRVTRACRACVGTP